MKDDEVYNFFKNPDPKKIEAALEATQREQKKYVKKDLETMKAHFVRDITDVYRPGKSTVRIRLNELLHAHLEEVLGEDRFLGNEDSSPHNPIWAYKIGFNDRAQEARGRSRNLLNL